MTEDEAAAFVRSFNSPMVTTAMPRDLTDNDLYYLRSILHQLCELRGLNDHNPSLGGEVLADNIDWLDCFMTTEVLPHKVQP